MKKAISTLLLSLVSFFGFSQTELHSDGGSFEDIIPWGEGYLGVVQTQAYAVMPKYRQFQFFDANGKLSWNIKVTPFNFNNVSLCNPESEFAYYVNMPYNKTAVTEKTSKTELLNLYQIDKSGNLVEKGIPYTGVLSPLAGLVKQLNTAYVGLTKNGILLVVNSSDENYHLVFIDHQFNVSYQPLTFKWDEKKYEENQLSLPKFILSDGQFSTAQMFLEGNSIKVVTKSFALPDLTSENEVVNTLDFSGYTLNSNNGYDLEYTVDERLKLSYTRERWVGNTIYKIPTLASFVEFTYSGDQLYAYSYFKNGDDEQAKSGFMLYGIDLLKDKESVPEYVFEFDKTEKNNFRNHTIHSGKPGEFVFISSPNSNELILKTSTGESVSYKGKVNIAQAFVTYISEVSKIDESKEIDCVSRFGNSYVGFDFEGFQNSYGNTKHVTVYTYQN